jgi:hypothetical protein
MLIEPLAPYDQAGNAIKVGDWVRVVQVPPGVAEAPRETRSVFRLAVGKTFRVEGFNEYGLAELNLSKKVAKGHIIWVEPAYLARSRRGRKPMPEGAAS